MGVARITARFQALAAAGRAGFVAYVMGGDPDMATAERIVAGLPAAGADIIELGFPFSDPMADGPSIQKAGLRALKAGTTLKAVLALAKRFRAGDAATPVILMGYANPVFALGAQAFADALADAGADGAILVDLPPEEDADVRAAFAAHDLALIRLATPTTDARRLPAVVEGVRGFVYYVSVAGVTGDKAIAVGDVEQAVARVRAASGLPVAVGFGVRTPDAAAATARAADAVVVGSAIVDAIAAAHAEGRDPAAAAHDLTRALSAAARGAKGRAA